MARLLPPERDIGVLQAPVRSCLALTGIFLLVLLSVGLLERIGVASGAALTAIVGAAFALFVLAGLLSHSRRAADFYVADRKIGGAFGGLAAAGSFAGLVMIGLAGNAYGSEAAFVLTAGGFAAGYLILAILIAPGLRSSGAYTPGDFLAARFGGFWVRLAWAVVAFSVSFLLLVAHLKIAGPLIATLLGITPAHALYVAAGLTIMAALPGGMRSLTWTQAIQYFVIALACLVPAGYLSLGGATGEIAVAHDLGALLIGAVPSLGGDTLLQSALPALLAAIGAASLPHLLARTLTTPSAPEAGASMAWGVLFSAMLALTGIVLANLLVRVAPQPLDGGISALASIVATMPAVLAGLLVAGLLAALFALGQAALFSATSAVSHDIFDEILDRRGPEGRRIFVARLALVGVAAGAVALAPRWQAEPGALLQWALALAAGGSFAPLALGIWWRRCNEIGALGGMVAGFGFTGLVFLMTQKIIPTFASDWGEVGAPGAAMVGVLIATAVTIAASLATPSPASAPPTGGDARGGPPIRERPA